MLEFNPFFRPSANEILQDKLFDDIRQASNEQPALNKITLSSELDDVTLDPNQIIDLIKVKLVEELISFKNP
jgi:hypothetical protein